MRQSLGLFLAALLLGVALAQGDVDPREEAKRQKEAN